MPVKVRALIVLVFVIAACAQTKIASYRDPEAPHEPYHSMLLYLSGELISQIELEQRVLSLWTINSETLFSSSLNLFPPTRTFDEEDTLRILRENNIASILLINLGAPDHQALNISLPNLAGGAPFVKIAPIQTRTYGQSTTELTVYTMSNQVLLYDVMKERTVWVGNVRSSAYDPSTLKWATINQVGQQLFDDGFLEKRHPNWSRNKRQLEKETRH